MEEYDVVLFTEKKVLALSPKGRVPNLSMPSLYEGILAVKLFYLRQHIIFSTIIGFIVTPLIQWRHHVNRTDSKIL
jgi:hypothetical protein